MNIETDGLVIKTQKIGETDTLITVLTSKYGLIRAFVRRSTAVKSNMLATTQLLSYNDFVFYKGKNSYSVTSATPKASFFKLNEDIDAMDIEGEDHNCQCGGNCGHHHHHHGGHHHG